MTAGKILIPVITNTVGTHCFPSTCKSWLKTT